MKHPNTLHPSNEGFIKNIGNWFGDRSKDSKFKTEGVNEAVVEATFKWLEEAKKRIQALPGVYDKDAWNMTVGKEARMCLIADAGGKMVNWQMILEQQGKTFEVYDKVVKLLQTTSSELVSIGTAFKSTSFPYERVSKQVKAVSDKIEKGPINSILTEKIYGRDRAYKATPLLVDQMRFNLDTNTGITIPELAYLPDQKAVHTVENAAISGADKGELIKLIDQILKHKKLLDDASDVCESNSALAKAVDGAADVHNKQKLNTDAATGHMTKEACRNFFDLAQGVRTCGAVTYYEIAAMARAIKIYVLGSERRIM